MLNGIEYSFKYIFVKKLIEVIICDNSEAKI